MKLRLLWLITLVLLLAVSLMAVAQGTTAESPEDNACYTGGSLEGKCDWPTEKEDEWAWDCGWYIARYDTGVFTLGQIPEWCNYFIATEDVIETICYDSSLSGQPDIMLTGPIDTPGNLTGFNSTDGSCSGNPFTQRETAVSAPYDPKGESVALSKCLDLTGDKSVLNLVIPLGYNAPTNWWACSSGQGI